MVICCCHLEYRACRLYSNSLNFRLVNFREKFFRMKKLNENNFTRYIIIQAPYSVRALSDHAASMEERAMACCVRGYHVYTLYSNGEYGHQIQRDVDPPD